MYMLAVVIVVNSMTLMHYQCTDLVCSIFIPSLYVSHYFLPHFRPQKQGSAYMRDGLYASIYVISTEYCRY